MYDLNYFLPGQLWQYDTRPGEENSLLTVLAIDDEEDHTIIHVRLDNINFGSNGYIQHLAFSAEAIMDSVTGFFAAVGNGSRRVLLPSLGLRPATQQRSKQTDPKINFYADGGRQKLEQKLDKYIAGELGKERLLPYRLCCGYWYYTMNEAEEARYKDMKNQRDKGDEIRQTGVGFSFSYHWKNDD